MAAGLEGPAQEVEESAATGGITLAPRAPVRAAVYAVLLPGAGHIYNKQLEKAVLLWIWSAIVGAVGLALLALCLLARELPPSFARPPLGDWVAEHAGTVALAWLTAVVLLWAGNIRNAILSAGRINRGEIVIQYGMRRQMVHVLGSQLLGFIPLVGLFFPPGVVAEAIDAAHGRRGLDRGRLLREGGQALFEWAITRIAFYSLGTLFGLWLLWWLLRTVHLAP